MNKKLDLGNRNTMTGKKRYIAEIICLMKPELYNYYKSIYNDVSKVYDFIGEYEDIYFKAIQSNFRIIEKNYSTYIEGVDIFNPDFYDDKPNIKKQVATIHIKKNNLDDFIISHEVVNSLYSIKNIDLGDDSLLKNRCMASIICIVYPELMNEYTRTVDNDNIISIKRFINKYKNKYNDIIINTISDDVYGINPFGEYGAILIIDRVENQIISAEIQHYDDIKEITNYHI